MVNQCNCCGCTHTHTHTHGCAVKQTLEQGGSKEHDRK